MVFKKYTKTQNFDTLINTWLKTDINTTKGDNMFNKSIILLSLFIIALSSLASCKKKEKKDDCYDNNKTDACEAKCANKEKKACAKWCHFAETIEACDEGCKMKDKPSCDKLTRLKKEKKTETTDTKKTETAKKTAAPYCTKGCNSASKGTQGVDFGSLTYTKLKTNEKTGAKVTISACIDKCIDQLVENCPKPAFKKQFSDICSKIK
jgi:hypothetical protein